MIYWQTSPGTPKAPSFESLLTESYAVNRGKDLQVTASGNLSAVIDEGTAMHLQVRLDGTRILNRDYDLCAELKRFGQLCPITADHLIVSQTIRVAKSIPKVCSPEDEASRFYFVRSFSCCYLPCGSRLSIKLVLTEVGGR